MRRNYVRCEFGTPKSKRSARSVPLASRVATELELIYVDYAPSERAAEWVEEAFRPTAPEPIDTAVTN